MKHRYLFGILILLIFSFLYMFQQIYAEAEEKAIHTLNAQQRLHARQAKQGIEELFDGLYLARFNRIWRQFREADGPLLDG